MSLNCLNGDDISVIKKKCDCESRQKIMRKLTEMKDVNDVDNIGCTFSEKEIKFDSISKSKTKEEMEMWKYISKLSIYLYNDYEFFAPLIVKQNSFDNEVFKSEMERLGYIRKANAWFQKQEPEEEVIISNIFNYCFTRFIFNSNQMILTQCTYYNSEIINGKCTICGCDIKDTVRTNEDDTVRDYKLIDLKDRMMGDNETIDVCQQNKSKIIDKFNSVENNQSNIRKNNKGNHESRDGETQTEVTDTCTNSSCLSGSIKLVDTHSKKRDKDYLSMDGDKTTSNNNKTYTGIETNKDVRNYLINDPTVKILELNKNELFGKSNNSVTKELLKELVSTNVRNESCLNEVIEINLTNKGCWRPASLDDDFKTSVRNSQKSLLKSSEHSSYWICDKCTFRNTDLNSLNCEICGTNRQLNEKSNNFTQSKTFHNCLYLNKDVTRRTHKHMRKANSEQESTPRTKNEETLKNNIIKEVKSADTTRNTKINDKWICNSCTFLNPFSSKMCEICRTINEDIDDGRDLEVPEEKWICRQCKTSNSFDRYKCSNCKESADFFNKWVCERCRFFNDKRANKCGVCENKNPNIVKCSQCKEKSVEKNDRCKDCLQKSVLPPMETVREKTLKWEKEAREKKEEGFELMKETGGVKFTKIIKTDSVDLMELKMCPNFVSCKGKVTNNDNKWCQKCKEKQWFCPNEDCGTINYLNKYCKKCKLQKDSDVSNCRLITALKDNKPAQMWMCGLCYKYTFSALHRCSHCKNQRDSPSNKKCICGWNNAPRHNNCDKCGEIIKKK